MAEPRAGVPSRYAELTREQLAALVPELLLCGHLIDRSGMAWCIAELGRDEMAQVAIEEWMAASPIYTRRMQRALGFEGDDVVTIFKGLQLDIGAPPQFLDFRFTVEDPWHGEFKLAHCGALADVEPMGEDYVRAMCHDIEDPTFDATAVATNPRAQVRPVHRPPRAPDLVAQGQQAGCPEVCHWTVVIADDHPEVHESAGCRELQESHAAGVVLPGIDPQDEGAGDYSGALLSDLDFGAFSRSALVRLADEVALQGQLLALGFARAVRARLDDNGAEAICGKQLVGIAGLAAERLVRALDLPADEAGALRLLALHPMLNPAAYVGMREDGDGLEVEPGAAAQDGGWLRLIGPDSTQPLQAAVQALDPRLRVEVDGEPHRWRVRVVRTEVAADDLEEVAVARFSTGTDFGFEPRRSLPITPV